MTWSLHDFFSDVNSEFSFTRFINMSAGELNSTMLAGLLVRYVRLRAGIDIKSKLNTFNYDM